MRGRYERVTWIAPLQQKLTNWIQFRFRFVFDFDSISISISIRSMVVNSDGRLHCMVVGFYCEYCNRILRHCLLGKRAWIPPDLCPRWTPVLRHLLISDPLPKAGYTHWAQPHAVPFKPIPFKIPFDEHYKTSPKIQKKIFDNHQTVPFDKHPKKFKIKKNTNRIRKFRKIQKKRNCFFGISDPRPEAGYTNRGAVSSCSFQAHPIQTSAVSRPSRCNPLPISISI